MCRVSLSFVSVGILLIALAMPGVAQSISTLQAPPSMLDSHSQNQDLLQVFTGTIVSTNDGILFLQDDAKDIRYGLDNQTLARKFAGKKVAVTGTLDKTGTIHIKSIEEQKV